MTLPLPSGDHRVSLAHCGLDRTYVLHVPPAAGPVAVVMMLHGAGGSAAFAVEETGWNAHADAGGFAVVYPEGVAVRAEKEAKFFTNPQEWNDGSGRGRHDDIGFLAAVIGDVARRVDIDPRRVFATGFSNGAGMTFRLAAERADLLAAIAPVAGYCWVLEPKPTRPVPTLLVVGDADPIVPLAGGLARTPWGKVADKPAVAETVEKWQRAVGEFEVRVVAGHGHHWPGGRGMLGEYLGGPISTELNATAAVWEFFRTRLRSGLTRAGAADAYT